MRGRFQRSASIIPARSSPAAKQSWLTPTRVKCTQARVGGETAQRLVAKIGETVTKRSEHRAHIDAARRVDHWFAGISRAPQEIPLTPCPAHAIVRVLLAELGHHHWEPLSEAARTISAAARFTVDGSDNAAAGLPTQALEAARALIGEGPLPSASSLPFGSLEQLNRRLRQSALFAPVERGAAVLPLLGRDVAIERAGIRTPLWALDALLDRLLASCGTWRAPSPAPVR